MKVAIVGDLLHSRVLRSDALLLTKLGAEGKILLVDARDNRNLDLASRNHPGWKTVDALAVNVYDVVDRPYLVVSEQALARLVEVLGS